MSTRFSLYHDIKYEIKNQFQQKPIFKYVMHFRSNLILR